MKLRVWFSTRASVRGARGGCEGDERLVSHERVHRVQEERHVVEVQVARSHTPNIEELLGNEIDIGDDDDVERLGRAWLGILGFALALVLATIIGRLGILGFPLAIAAIIGRARCAALPPRGCRS